MDRKYVYYVYPSSFFTKTPIPNSLLFSSYDPLKCIFPGVMPPDFVNFYNFNARKKYYNVIF